MKQPMNTSLSQQASTCPPGSLAGGLTRTRFFDGMLLTQADLENEQSYWRMKRRLTNRALGTGVVWGLRLTLDQKTQRYRLSPGYALDCCGNDIVVECPVEVSHADLVQRSQLDATTIRTSFERGRTVCVVLQYVECPDGARAVQRDACSPAGTTCEASRIRESCRLLLVPECEDPRGCAPLAKFRERLHVIQGKLAGTGQVGNVGNVGAPANTTSGKSGAPDARWLPRVTAGTGQETLGSWLLTLLHGYLATAEQYHVSAQAHVIASSMMTTVCTALLEIELDRLDETLRGELTHAVQELAGELCAALVYPGPRCADDLHGVYLGCATVSLNGTIESFSPWACRRDVLTGPLLSWWMCQLGIAPVDTIVHGVANSLCEVSRVTEDAVFEKSGQLLEMVSSTAASQRTLTPFDFIATLARSVGTSTTTGLVAIDATTPGGGALNAVVPRAAISAQVSQVATITNTQLTGVAPLSRGPLRDVVDELAARTPMTAIVSGLDPTVASHLATTPVRDLVESDPEAMLARIAGATPTAAQRASVNAAFANGEAFIRSATVTLVDAVGKAGVTRAQLTDAPVKSALVHVAGTTAAAIDAATAAAVKR